MADADHSAEPKIITRAEARDRGLKYYFTGKTCIRGHTDKRYVSMCACFTCNAEITANNSPAWRAENKEATKKHSATYLSKPGKRARLYESNKKWQAENTDKCREYSRRSNKKVEKTPDRMKTRRKTKSAWSTRNPDKRAAATARRRATQKMATPPWADLQAIQVFYSEAQRISRETGIPHQVDHVVPLSNKAVCGLHVPWNLQVLTKKANKDKGNSFTPGEVVT